MPANTTSQLCSVASVCCRSRPQVEVFVQRLISCLQHIVHGVHGPGLLCSNVQQHLPGCQAGAGVQSCKLRRDLQLLARLLTNAPTANDVLSCVVVQLVCCLGAAVSLACHMGPGRPTWTYLPMLILLLAVMYGLSWKVMSARTTVKRYGAASPTDGTQSLLYCAF